MTTEVLRCIPMNEVNAHSRATSRDWLWDGYLAPRDLTLFTSQWKAGKTTLLAGLLQMMERGGEFLGRPLRPGKALVVSEESLELWAERLTLMPIGPHVQLLPRPNWRRDSFDAWQSLIEAARRMREAGGLDLFVVDPMAKFVPGAWESNAVLLMDALEPLHELTSAGVAVLLLHHPRKKPSEPGHSARGTGALLGFVDIALELSRFGRLTGDDRRRQLIALSRHVGTPARLVYEWDPATGQFAAIGDPGKIQFEQNWATLLAILQKRTVGATHLELWDDWPSDQHKPARSILYEWLNRAFEEKRLRREGNGTRTRPWRFRLEDKNDWYWDRGLMPPLEPL